MQDPLKQGLKLYSNRYNIDIVVIRMQDPLKQGLKLSGISFIIVCGSVFECKIH